MTPEGRVKLKVKTFLNSFASSGIWYFMPPASGYGRAGIPDIVGCYRRHFFAIECKAKKPQPTALQLRELEKIEHAFGRTWVVSSDTLDAFQMSFKDWCNKVDGYTYEQEAST